MQTPKEVTRIAWLFAGVGLLLMLSSALAFLTFPREDFLQSRADAPPPLWVFRLMSRVFEHLQIVAIVTGVLGAAALVGGINFLRLRRWARTVLEGLSYIALTYIVGFMLIWLIGWISAAASVVVAAAGTFHETFGIWGAIIGTLFVLLAGAGFAAVALIYVPRLLVFPLIRIIKYLRSEALRDVLTRSAQ